MNKSIHESKEICNRLRENNLIGAISEYALGYIMSILITAWENSRHSKKQRPSPHKYFQIFDRG